MVSVPYVRQLDDIDRLRGVDTDAEQRVGFILDGQAYEIDLSPANLTLFRDNLGPFLPAAREASNGHEPGIRRPRRNLSEIREQWRLFRLYAVEQGWFTAEQVAVDAYHTADVRRAQERFVREVLPGLQAGRAATASTLPAGLRRLALTAPPGQQAAPAEEEQAAGERERPEDHMRAWALSPDGGFAPEDVPAGGRIVPHRITGAHAARHDGCTIRTGTEPDIEPLPVDGTPITTDLVNSRRGYLLRDEIMKWLDDPDTPYTRADVKTSSYIPVPIVRAFAASRAEPETAPPPDPFPDPLTAKWVNSPAGIAVRKQIRDWLDSDATSLTRTVLDPSGGIPRKVIDAYAAAGLGRTPPAPPQVHAGPRPLTRAEVNARTPEAAARRRKIRRWALSPDGGYQPDAFPKNGNIHARIVADYNKHIAKHPEEW